MKTALQNASCSVDHPVLDLACQASQIIGRPLARLVLLLATGLGNSGIAQVTVIKGELDYHPLTTGKHETRWFSLDLTEKQWRIETRFPEGDVDLVTDSFDGTNTTQVIKSAKSLKQPAILREPCEVPNATLSTFAAQVWLALASANYFQNHTKQYAPVWHLDDPLLRTSGYTTPGDRTLLEEAPRLPKRMTYYSDGTIRGVDDQERHFVREYWAPYNQGFVRAEYEVLGLTNVAGQQLPAEFIYRHYRPLRTGRNTNDIELSWTLKGKVTGIEMTTEAKTPANPISR